MKWKDFGIQNYDTAQNYISLVWAKAFEYLGCV